MNLLLNYDFITSCFCHLENTDSLGYIDFLIVDRFHNAIQSTEHQLCDIRDVVFVSIMMNLILKVLGRVLGSCQAHYSRYNISKFYLKA